MIPRFNKSSYLKFVHSDSNKSCENIRVTQRGMDKFMLVMKVKDRVPNVVIKSGKQIDDTAARITYQI